MASYVKLHVAVVFLFVADRFTAAMASADPSASPMASPNGTVSVRDRVVEWLKITALPLAVILSGYCLWGLFKNTTLGRSCLGHGDEPDAPAREDEAVRPAV